MEEFDVIVLGTGSAGLVAAIKAHDEGARVAIFEKADKVGGTTAWSGGMIWIPCNHHMAEAGITDSVEDVQTYLGSLSFGLIDPAMIEAFVAHGVEAVKWLEDHTPAKFQIIPGFPDYHSENPCAKRDGGRSMENPLFSFKELGDWADRVTTGRQLGGGASGVHITLSETPLGHGAPQGIPEDELERRRAADLRGAGNGLVGMLLKGCLDRGIEPRTNHRAVELITEDGRITGVRFEGGYEASARGGVILATGGFEWDPELSRAFLRGPLERPVSIETNTGDGLKMAMKVGASLGNMREAWWTATIDVPDGRGGVIPWMVNGERTRPHTIMVNGKGVRFTNESANYNAIGAAFHNMDVTSFTYENLPSWMIFDQFYVERYVVGGYRGEKPTPDWLTEAPTLAELAGKLGIPADALEATVERWNEMCAAGEDLDFGRGKAAHDQWWGDPDLTGEATASLGPLDKPPFYAVETHIGALGTKGGPRTTADAQVIDLDGNPIPGLYAAGNVMASVMGMTYGGAGGTLGPGLAFGYAAAKHAAAAAKTT